MTNSKPPLDSIYHIGVENVVDLKCDGHFSIPVGAPKRLSQPVPGPYKRILESEIG